MEILASVLGGLVGGLFTFLGVWFTIRYQREKDKKDEQAHLKEKQEELKKAKPRLEILKHKAIHAFSDKEVADINAVLAPIRGYDKSARRMKYDSELLDKKNWVCVEYVLKNTGLTDIDHLYISTNLPKDTALFEVDNDEYKVLGKQGILNYSVIFDKRLIKPQQTIKLRICYISDKIPISNIGSAPISIWLMDTNKNVWEQALFAPQNKIYDSTISSYEDFRNYCDVRAALDCFDNPILW